MNIFSSIDCKNIEKIIILFSSCYLNANQKKRDKLKFYLLIDKLPKNNVFIPDFIKDKLEIREVNYNEEWTNILNDFNNNFYKECVWCKHDMNFFRFLFFRTFPEVDRVVFLDWDMIVQTDIFNLQNEYNNKDNLVVAQLNEKTLILSIFRSKFNFNPFARKLYSKLYNKIFKAISSIDIPSEKFKNVKNFNSGFFIISRDHWEENNLKEFILSLISVQKEYGCFNFGTQVVQNLMNLDNRIYIDREWNITPIYGQSNKSNIIHWCGHTKPWLNREAENNKLWWKYFDIVNKMKNNSKINVVSEFVKPKLEVEIKGKIKENKVIIPKENNYDVLDCFNDKYSWQSILIVINIIFSFLLLNQSTEIDFSKFIMNNMKQDIKNKSNSNDSNDLSKIKKSEISKLTNEIKILKENYSELNNTNSNKKIDELNFNLSKIKKVEIGKLHNEIKILKENYSELNNTNINKKIEELNFNLSKIKKLEIEKLHNEIQQIKSKKLESLKNEINQIREDELKNIKIEIRNLKEKKFGSIKYELSEIKEKEIKSMKKEISKLYEILNQINNKNKVTKLKNEDVHNNKPINNEFKLKDNNYEPMKEEIDILDFINSNNQITNVKPKDNLRNLNSRLAITNGSKKKYISRKSIMRLLAK